MFCRVSRVVLLAASLALIFTFPALAQTAATGGNVSLDAQICPQVLNQAAAAEQNNGGGSLASTVAQNLGISQSAVNRCLQGGGDAAGNAGGAAGTGEGGTRATGGNVSINVQVCPQVVEQYANAEQSNTGGGIAAGIAQNLGVSQDAVNECIQGDPGSNPGGDTGEASGPATTETTDPVAPETEPPAARNEVQLAGPDGDVLAATIPNKVLAKTGGPSLLLPLAGLFVGLGLMGFAAIKRR